MAQPSTSAQMRAVALREAVSSLPIGPIQGTRLDTLDAHEAHIIKRAEKFAAYIEFGVDEEGNLINA